MKYLIVPMKTAASVIKAAPVIAPRPQKTPLGPAPTAASITPAKPSNAPSWFTPGNMALAGGALGFLHSGLSGGLVGAGLGAAAGHYGPGLIQPRSEEGAA